MLIAACDPGARESGLCLVEFVDGLEPDVIAAYVVCRLRANRISAMSIA